MGCDIHLFTERKVNGKWEAIGSVETEYPGTEYEYTRLEDGTYSGRNYDLFGILANVRNGYGFAGVVTGAGVIPISQPRGLPDDVSSKVRAESDRWEGDGHSHSYLTLADLLAYDWNQNILKLGVVDVESFLRLDTSHAFVYSGGVFGRNVVVMEQLEAHRRRENGEDITKLCTHVRILWTTTYRARVGEFVENVIPQLQLLGDPEDVRIVFWFDN